MCALNARPRRLVALVLVLHTAVPGAFANAPDVRAASPLEPPGPPPAWTFSDGSGAHQIDAYVQKVEKDRNAVREARLHVG